MASPAVNARSARQSGGHYDAGVIPPPPEPAAYVESSAYSRSQPAYGRVGGNGPTFAPYVRTPALNTHAAPATYSLYSRGVTAPPPSPPTSPSLQLLLSRRQLWQGEPSSDSSETVVVKSLPLIYPHQQQQHHPIQPFPYHQEPQLQHQPEFHVERDLSDDDLLLSAAIAEESPPPPRLARLTIARLPQLPEPQPVPPPTHHSLTSPLAIPATTVATAAAPVIHIHNSRIPTAAAVLLRGRQRAPTASSPTTPTTTTTTTTTTTSNGTSTTKINATSSTLRQRKISMAGSFTSSRQSAPATTTIRGLGRDGPAAFTDRGPALIAAGATHAPTTTLEDTGTDAWEPATETSRTTMAMADPTVAALLAVSGEITTRREPETVDHPELG